MRVLLFITSILIILSGNLSSQNFKKLSKQKMIKDFDAFINFQKEVNPQLEIRKIVTGYDIISELEKLKKNIDTITNPISYYNLLYLATGLCHDLHNRPYDGLSLNFKFFLHFFKNKRQLDWLDYIQKSTKTLSQFIYLNNKCYNKFPYTIDDINAYLQHRQISDKAKFFNVGIELKKIYNYEPDTFISKFALKSYTRWDFQKKKFYLNEIKCFKSNIANNAITSYINESKNEISWNSTDSILYRIDRNSYNMSDSAFVKFIEKDKILFIRMPSMTNWAFYPKEIQKFKDKIINKIIFDLRGNGGGDDNTWLNALMAIIALPIEVNENCIVRNSELAIKLLKIKNPKLVENVSYLSNNNYIIFSNQKYTISPDKSGIKYKGKIYILKDENSFSSSLAFTSMAEYLDNIVSVGTFSGRIGGRGIAPVHITLPYSKVIVQLEPVLDLTGCNTAEDTYHDKVELLVEPDLKFYELLYNADNPYTDEFLYNNDPFFIKVLNDK